MPGQAIDDGATSYSARKPATGDADADTALIAFDNVWRHWGRGRKRWAVLRGVDLHIAAGAAVCVAGANGAGKTTLLRIATTLLSADRGSVTVDGVPSNGNWRQYHSRIGFLSAGDRGLYNRFSVRGHLEFAASLALMPRRAHRPAVDGALAHFGLTDLAERRAERLSQGQRQRLRLALAFVHQPKVVLLDEPRNSLDVDGLAMLSQAVTGLLARGGSALWCAPAGELPAVPFDRAYLIADGTLQSMP